jgi:hypothetical protein
MATPSPVPDAPITGKQADEFVSELSDEQKDALFGSLVREAVRVNGDTAVIPVGDATGQPLGFFVPPGAAVACFKVVPPVLTPEREAAIRAALANPGDTFDPKEFFKQLAQEDAN